MLVLDSKILFTHLWDIRKGTESKHYQHVLS